MTKVEEKIEQFLNCVKAGYSHFVITTYEPERIQSLLTKRLLEYKTKNGESPFNVEEWDMVNNDEDPNTAFIQIAKAKIGTLTFLKNFHWFLSDNAKDREILTQTIQNTAIGLRSPSVAKSIIILTPLSLEETLPIEIQKDFVGFSFPLPDEEEIAIILEKAIKKGKEDIPPFKPPKEKDKKQLVRSALGMTGIKIQDAYFLSIIKHNKICASEINKMRADQLNNIKGLKVLDSGVKLENVIGYDLIKANCVTQIKSPLSLGSLFVGPPGTGKTMITEALANASGKLALVLEPAELGGKYVGESEALVKRVVDALFIIKDAVVLIDEFEKGFAGVGGAESGGNEVAQRSMSQLLKAMNSTNRPRGLKIFGTANAIKRLLDTAPEFLRVGRWDTAPIYMGFPKNEAKQKMIEHYRKKYEDLWFEETGQSINIKGKLTDKDTEKWTGAECEGVVRIAMNSGGEMTLKEATILIRPIAIMAKKNIEHLESMKHLFVDADGIESGEIQLKSKNGRNLIY